MLILALCGIFLLVIPGASLLLALIANYLRTKNEASKLPDL
jgi:hypothetical protein